MIYVCDIYLISVAASRKVSVYCSKWEADLILEFLDDLALVGEPACFEFGVNQLSVRDNIEDTFASRDQLSVHTEGAVQFLRQTGGIGSVVSLGTVMDFDLHDTPPGQLLLQVENDIRVNFDYTSAGKAVQYSIIENCKRI